jgi:hypothetical protein
MSYDIEMTISTSPEKLLPEEALSSLKEVLKKDIGIEATESLSDIEISKMGYFFLHITAMQLKIRLRERDNNRPIS